MRTRLTIDLEPEQKQRLAQLAQRRRISVRQLVLESLDESLKKAIEEDKETLPSLAGTLRRWAIPALRDQEATAWGDSVAENPTR